MIPQAINDMVRNLRFVYDVMVRMETEGVDDKEYRRAMYLLKFYSEMELT